MHSYYATESIFEEGTVLLVVSTILYGGEIVAAHFLRHTIAQRYVGIPLILVSLVMPVDCNNIFMRPILSLIRVLAFFGIYFITRSSESSSVNLVMYTLFAKFETFVVLVPLHAIFFYVQRGEGKGHILPTTRHDHATTTMAQIQRLIQRDIVKD